MVVNPTRSGLNSFEADGVRMKRTAADQRGIFRARAFHPLCDLHQRKVFNFLTTTAQKEFKWFSRIQHRR